MTWLGAHCWLPLNSAPSVLDGSVRERCKRFIPPLALRLPLAGTTLTASLSLTIGTDCVGTFGDFGPCSSVCIDKEGSKGKTFNVVSPQDDGRAVIHVRRLTYHRVYTTESKDLHRTVCLG
jgi:hypothetical protein